MPIKPENRHRYPADWPQIRLQVLEEARYQCQWDGCSARHHAVGCWRMARTGWVWQPLSGSGPVDAAGWGQSWPDLQLLDYAEAREFAQAHNEGPVVDGRAIVIVLTIAHLDHEPENCERSNLRALCQRHHLHYDQQHHLQTAYMGRKAASGNLDLELA